VAALFLPAEACCPQPAAANGKKYPRGDAYDYDESTVRQHDVFGGNAPFVEELYENYLNDPTSVPAEWRDYFDRLAQMPGYVARDVAHAPVIAAFAELAKDGGFRPRAPAPVLRTRSNRRRPAGDCLPLARHPLG
jgi:hypothetical protein